MPRIKKDHPIVGWGYHRIMAKLKSKKLLQEIIKERPDKSEAEIKKAIKRAIKTLTAYYNGKVMEHEESIRKACAELKIDYVDDIVTVKYRKKI